MISKELRSGIENLAKEELKNANKSNPLFHSSHEGAAVITEEVAETEQACEETISCLIELWDDVFGDNYLAFHGDIMDIREEAVSVATEAVQVIAMCDKWIMSNINGKG